MNVLSGCELSGRVRDAFRRHGHNAYSNDILGPDSQEWWIYPKQQFPEFHIVGDLLDVATRGTPDGEPWDLLIAFPPCTYLARYGLHWNNVRPERADRPRPLRQPDGERPTPREPKPLSWCASLAHRPRHR